MNEFDRLPAIITVAEAARVMRIGIGTCYSAVRRGEIPSKRIGGRIIIAKDSLVSLLSGGVLAPAGQSNYGMGLT